MITMKLNRIPAVVLALLAPVAHGASQYPTLWTLHNLSNTTVEVSCEAEKDASQVDLRLPATRIRPGGQAAYNWGASYYNDGLGLNAAHWTCTVVDLSGAGAGGIAGAFSTDWGETLGLKVSGQGGNFRVVKQEASLSRRVTRPADSVEK